MYFYSVQDLSTDPKSVWENLSAGKEVIITKNGKPSALLIDLPKGSFDEIVQAVRKAKVIYAFNNMDQKTAINAEKIEE